MNAIEYLIKELAGLGIRDFFGLSGDYNSKIADAIESNPNTTWIECTNALNAGYAADGYARQKGFGAFVTNYRAGELSALNAVIGSYAENVPIVHIVGVPSTEVLSKESSYNYNFKASKQFTYMEAYKPVVEEAVFLSKDNIRIEIDRLLKLFVKERKPIYIAIPEDIALMELSVKESDYEWISNPDTLERAVDLIVEKISNAKKPVIIADALVKRFDAENEFIEFVNKSGIPVSNFLMGANIINIDTENYIGTFLSKYGNPEVKEYIDESDCLIAAGALYGEINSFDTFLPSKINSNIAIYGTHTYIDGEKYGDIKMSDVFRGITKKINHKNYQFQRAKKFYEPLTASKEQLTSHYIYSRLQEYFKEGDIIVTEAGTIPLGIAPIKFPEHCKLHQQLLWNSTGWATPAALGVAIASPNSRVILLTDDIAHQISCIEVGNIIRNGFKPIIIVIKNNGNTNQKFNATHTVQIDYSRLARSFKGEIWATKVETQDDFDKALRVTNIMDKLCYIEAIMTENDLPEISKQIFAEVNNQPTNKKAKSARKIKEDEKLTSSASKNYKTNVHISLKEYEE